MIKLHMAQWIILHSVQRFYREFLIRRYSNKSLIFILKSNTMQASRRFLNRPIQTQQSDSAEPFFAPARQVGVQAKGEDTFFAPSAASNGVVQTKLTVNAPNDMYEQEADTMANKVVQRMSVPKEEEPIQRKCAECEKEEHGQVQRKADGSGIAPSGVTQQIESSKGSGSKLSDDTRTQMEGSFGTDFSNVTIHTDRQSADMNNALHAQAFTHGSDIYFNEGKYNPQNTEGGRLLAHELTHVVQQGETIRRSCPQGKSPRVIRDSCGMGRPIDESNYITHLEVSIANRTVRATWLNGTHSEWECTPNPQLTPTGSDVVGIKCGINHTSYKRARMAYFTAFQSTGMTIGFHDSQPIGSQFVSHGCVRVRCNVARIINHNSWSGQTTINVR
jgi:Domain of unknown function (DUF4157)